MKLLPGKARYDLPAHFEVRAVEIDFRTKDEPDEKHYRLVPQSTATIKAARKVDDRPPQDPVYYCIDRDGLEIDPPPVRPGKLVVRYLPPVEEV